MMRSDIAWMIKWVLPSSLAAAWSIRVILDGSFTGLAYSVVGMGILLCALWLYLRSRRDTFGVWNEERGQLAVFRPLSIQVHSVMLFGSIPVGIDLSHNASGVLRAMYESLREERDTSLQFVLCRPLGNELTRVGFAVTKSSIRPPHGMRQLTRLSDDVFEKSEVLRSSMHASYPHVPVRRATREETTMILSGGILGR
ncbi:MAG: hypothetical protein HXY34_00515 [Candidatus Thorarchaeota archaeon]|nr:hypothetical protein [Candidatus Thorarchaeota archaeon]